MKKTISLLLLAIALASVAAKSLVAGNAPLNKQTIKLYFSAVLQVNIPNAARQKLK